MKKVLFALAVITATMTLCAVNLNKFNIEYGDDSIEFKHAFAKDYTLTVKVYEGSAPATSMVFTVISDIEYVDAIELHVGKKVFTPKTFSSKRYDEKMISVFYLTRPAIDLLAKSPAFKIAVISDDVTIYFHSKDVRPFKDIAGLLDWLNEQEEL